MFYLSQSLEFPNPSEADSDGLLAVGGDLTPERLLIAYNSGIFPWYENNQPILWWSPNPRMILYPEKMKVSKSLRKLVNKETYQVTFNTVFSEVIKNCSTIKREGQGGTWITEEMQKAYIDLHKLGHIISVEVWRDGNLVGGLYGIDLPKKKVFCGESMFSSESNVSKVAFYYLVLELEKRSYKIIDCQLYTTHLESLGAEEVSRQEFLQILDN
ncbi:MAG: leucyl/phenylalanyl-tRNA--protein transferase [Flavobacteriaceae bacterium]|jgi:leucyl/phenylalanyl-tRNA--protein transferase